MMQERIKLLVLEDNPDLRQIMVDYLALQDDLEVIGSAGDGAEGMELVGQHQPDVILLDLIMPNFDGFSILEKLHTLEGKRPQVIVTSAVGQEDFIRRAIDMGVRYYMVKPYDMEVLVRRVRETKTSRAVRS
ncbi:MAG: response regulator, partial [Christensenellales bacterium]